MGHGRKMLVIFKIFFINIYILLHEWLKHGFLTHLDLDKWPIFCRRHIQIHWTNGQYFAEDIFKYILLNENISILIHISLIFVSWGLKDNKSALTQVMAWQRTGDKPLPESMLPKI